MFDILVAGEINPDLILTGDVTPEFGQVEQLVDSAHLVVGSSSAIFACGAARLGLKVAIIGACGDDLFGRFMLSELRLRNVDVGQVIVRKEGETGLSVILNRQADRAILTFPGLIGALRAEDVPDALLRQARHLHVASYFLQTSLQADVPALFQRARALELTTSLDPNYDPSGTWEGFDELLAVTSVFLPNEAEALSLTESLDVDAALSKLRAKSEAVVVKMGAAGAQGVYQDRMARAKSIAVKVVDAIGAGDSFDAGFLYGYLAAWSFEKSMQLACACGALSTQQAGGTNGQPTLEEAIKHVSG